MLLKPILVAIVALVSTVIATPTPIDRSALPLPQNIEFDKRQLASEGQIASPANGTRIAPGQSFDFLYLARSSRIYESLGYSVYLLTSSPDNLIASLYASDASGWYFGRYKTSSRFDPNPPNPPPTTLTMPNFSTLPDSGGAGASNLYVYLVVLEDWSWPVYSSGPPRQGHTLAVAANWLIYNATST